MLFFTGGILVRSKGIIYLLTIIVLMITSNKSFSMHSFSDLIRRTDSAGSFELFKVRFFNDTNDFVFVTMDGYLIKKEQVEKSVLPQSSIILDLINRLGNGQTVKDKLYPTLKPKNCLTIKSCDQEYKFHVCVKPNLELSFKKIAAELLLCERTCPDWVSIEPTQSDSDN